MNDIKPILTDEDHRAALKELNDLWNCKPGTPEYDRFDELSYLVDEYEATHHTIPPPEHMAPQLSTNGKLLTDHELLLIGLLQGLLDASITLIALPVLVPVYLIKKAKDAWTRRKR
jgi:HTH-type transcriptional regulator/antitoxin HigA